MPAASLPILDSLDLEAVKALLIDQHEKYTATLNSRNSEIERLVLLVEKLQRMLFGTKSEKVLRQIEQLELQLEELQAANAVEELQAAAPAERPVTAKPFRRPLLDIFPAKSTRTCPFMKPAPTAAAGCESWARMLERVRACFKVIRHVRPKLSCDACDRIVQAPAPSRPIDRGLAGPGLLAHVLVSKYADHSPLYRQSEIYAREGVDLDRTLAKLSRKSDTAAAIRYALSRWSALTRYASDDQLGIDNNAAERALRVVALGRKNFLFAGSNAGGERAAAIYSLLGSAKLNGLDPELCLHHVLERIADHPINKINGLLPWNVSLSSQYDHS